MKKILLTAIMGVMAFGASAQLNKKLSFGLIGATLEFPVAKAITVGPSAFTNFDVNRLVVGAKANYYFNELFSLPPEWDVYGGANLGFGMKINDNGHDSGLDLGLQIGGRWFWNPTWGIYLELGGGDLGGNAGLGGGIGVTMNL